MAQWYKENPSLLKAEKKAMEEFMGDKAIFTVLEDGNACWLVSVRPKVPCKAKCSKCLIRKCSARCAEPDEEAEGIKCRKYDLALEYDSDHPKARSGSSVKAIPLKPSINELQETVNRTEGVYPKTLAHLLVDNDELYLCSTSSDKVSTDVDSEGGVTSAATSLRYATRWIYVFEAGLIDKEIWAKFHEHGQI